MQNKIDDQELIARSLNDDHNAYAALIDRYKNALYRHCFAILRDEDISEDIAQETFITAYYKLNTYRTEYRFSTWLFKIATNKALSQLKKAKRETRMDPELQDTIVSTLPRPDQQSLHNELHQAVDSLQPKQRAVISLYYWQGHDYAEIARNLAAPIGSVKVWMKRAKQQLKKELS